VQSLGELFAIDVLDARPNDPQKDRRVESVLEQLFRIFQAIFRLPRPFLEVEDVVQVPDTTDGPWPKPQWPTTPVVAIGARAKMR